MNTKLWKSCTIKRCSLLSNGGISRILIVSLYGGHKNQTNKLVSMYNHFLHTVILLGSFWIFFSFLCICLGSDLIYTNETVGSAKVSFLLFYKVIKMYGFQAGIWIFIFTKVKISLLVFYDDSGAKVEHLYGGFLVWLFVTVCCSLYSCLQLSLPKLLPQLISVMILGDSNLHYLSHWSFHYLH